MEGGPDSVCVLGIDLGTTSVKAALLVGTEQGQVVAESCSRETQAYTSSVEAGLQGMEQDSGRIIRALNECLAALPQQQLQRVSHIGITGQMHGIVFWKRDQGCKWTEGGTGPIFEPEEVSHLVTWQDGRCSPAFLSSLPLPQSHISLATGFGCATIYWYLKKRLKKSGFPVHLLPEVGDPGSIAGRTISAWHGIPKGTKVGIALGDFQCSVYSCLTERTDAVLNISTSAQLTISMPSGFQPPETPDPSSAVTYFPYFDGDYLAVAASLNGGNVLATFVNMVARWTEELGFQIQESAIYAKIIKAALDQNDSHLSVHPTIFGERHTPERLASVTSIAASELSLGHVTRAVCRGLIENLCSMLPVQRLLETGVRRVLGSGSALARNEVLRQEVERIFPFPVVYGKDVDAAVGAAMVMFQGK
ncbi:sedoheptulokinase isoform X2 [Tympanuchus pallidicinctus]|uniref:sedoheptulokinase isoform X2 n=1 Tax=Tympanuchus pallidicinctus TaxID=109042 RepID=UPI002287207B|nr:sedoheptulokinase isoform X2 [Tympanuchus pallidicinctus]